MYLIEPLEESGRYVMHALPCNMNLAMARVHIDHQAGVSALCFEAWEVGQMMGGN